MKTSSQRGFSLIEALIGMAVLGLIILAWMSLEVFTAQTVRKVSDLSASQKVTLMIMNDILSAERGIPPVDVVPAQLHAASLTRAQLEAAFASVPTKKSICYDRNAVLSAAVSCYYNVSYFKYRVDDRSMSSETDLRRIPLARVVVMITWRDLTHRLNMDADPANDVTDRRYMTRLVSNVADF